MRRLLALGVLVLAAANARSVQASTITFEDHAVASGTAIPSSGDLTSDGFLFEPASNGYQLANNSAKVDDGSTYLVTEGSPLSEVTFSQVGGGPFALTSIDYAEWQSDIPGSHAYPTQIAVIGNQVGGSTVSTTLFLDGVFDGPGGQPDFQTFAFDSSWVNLLSVSLLGTGATTGNLNYFAIDNIAVDTTISSVPEPASLTLLGIGAAGLIARRRRTH